MEIRVYESLLPEVEKKLEKVAKKAVKYGVPFSYEVGEPCVVTVGVHAYDTVNKCVYLKTSYKVRAVPVTISEALIRENGWAVRAKIEATEAGNVVEVFGEVPGEMVAEWAGMPMRCDHCGTNRLRKVTFMVQNESGEFRQVGRGCLKEYTGIDPARCALMAAVREYELDESVSEEEFLRGAGKASRAYDMVEVLAFAADEIEKYGYVSSESPRATKYAVMEAMSFGSKAVPSEKGIEKAKAVLEWLKGLERTAERMMGPEGNVIPFAIIGYCREKDFGRVCYMPKAYDREMERIAKEKERAARNAAEACSEYVGSVGERMTFVAKTAQLIYSFETVYGTTWVYKMVDGGGNVFVWYSSRSVAVRDGMNVVGTVKDHKEYKGVRQTVLTRCKVA